MSQPASFARAALLLAALGAFSAPARAAFLYVDRRSGSEGASGATADEAMRTISEAVAAAEPGDRIFVAPGHYGETLRIHTDDLAIVAEAGVVLEAVRFGIVVTSTGVRVSGLEVRGGDGAGRAVFAAEGGQIGLDDVLIDGFEGSGLWASGPEAAIELRASTLDGTGAVAVLAEDGGRVSIEDSVVRGFRTDTSPAAMIQGQGAGSRIDLVHALVTGAPRHCLKSLDGAAITLDASIVGVCGLSYEGSMQNYPLVQADDATLVVRRSLVQGQAAAPHTRLSLGTVELDEHTVLNGDPAYAGFAGATGTLSITVDDSPNLVNALSLSTVMDAHDAHLSFFANFPGNLSWAEQADLGDLVERGHEVGCHAVTNGRLTQEVPLYLTWDGSADAAWVDIDEAGERLAVRARRDGLEETLVGPVDLGSDAGNVLWKVCDAIDAHPALGCAVSEEDPSSIPVYALATGLASGAFSLAPGQTTGLAWDRRLPSEGGRHYTNELVTPKGILEEIIGQPVTSLAYPGQRHDETVRRAVEDAGFHIARGATAYSAADHLLGEPVDIFQSPLALTVDAAKGPDFADLDPAAQEARIRAFARAWAAFALEAGAMGALTIHSPETFDATQLAWLMDELDGSPLRILSLGELRDFVEEHGTSEDGRTWAVHLPALDDHRPTALSDTVDRAVGEAGRRTDALGQPVYGTPDIGPFEHQPTAWMGEDALPVGVPVRVYADGGLRPLGAGAGVARLGLVPLGGLPELAADAPRPAWLDLEITTWSADHVAWTATVAEGATQVCVAMAGLAAERPFRVTSAGGLVGTAWSDGEGLLRVPVQLGAGPVEVLLSYDNPVSGALLDPCEGPSLHEGGVMAPGLAAAAGAPADAGTAAAPAATTGCSALGGRCGAGLGGLLLTLLTLGGGRRRRPGAGQVG